MTVKLIKTIIGEEMVAKLVDDSLVDGGYFLFSKPRLFQWQQGPTGKMEPVLAPWIMLDPENETVPIATFYIASIFDASPTLEKSYLAATSNIQVVTNDTIATETKIDLSQVK